MLVSMILPAILGSFAVVFAIMFFGRAREAGRNPWSWAIGIGAGYFIVSWLGVVVAGFVAGALVDAAFARIAAQIVTAYVLVVVVCASVCDRLAEAHLRRAGA